MDLDIMREEDWLIVRYIIISCLEICALCVIMSYPEMVRFAVAPCIS